MIGPPSQTSHLPPLYFSAGHAERANSVKLLGINLGAGFIVEVTRRGHHVQGNSETLFCKTTQACGCPPRPVASFLIIHRGNQACTGICGPSLESLAHESRKHKLTNSKQYKDDLLGIIYSYTNDMPYINTLYCAAIPSLADRREQLPRKFFKSVQEKTSSCLSSLLPNPRDSSITTRLRFANKFSRLPNRTKKYQTFISYALSHYQAS